MVLRKSGGMRPKINLKLLNNFVETILFKMETLQIVLDLLQKGDYFVSLDLKDVYFSILIHHEYRNYLKESDVRVSRPSFRTRICSKNIHKMHEASYVSSEVSWSSGNYLHRRFSVDGKQCTDSGGNQFIGS